MTVNISEFAPAKRPTVQIAANLGAFLSGILAICTFFGALVYDPTGPVNGDANATAFKVLLLSSLTLLLLFLTGLAAGSLIATHHPEHVTQAEVKAAAWQRLNERYGVPIPDEPIQSLSRGYRNNCDRPVAGDSATFDSMHPDGTPGKFIVRTDATGGIDLFAAPGIKWAAVPVLDVEASR